MGSACRQIERVPMPVQDGGHALHQLRQTGPPPSGAGLSRRPSDLLVGSREHLGPQGAGHELSAKADSQGREICHETPLQQAQLVGQEGIVMFLVGPYRTPKNDEDLGGQGFSCATSSFPAWTYRTIRPRCCSGCVRLPRSSHGTRWITRASRTMISFPYFTRPALAKLSRPLCLSSC